MVKGKNEISISWWSNEVKGWLRSNAKEEFTVEMKSWPDNLKVSWKHGHAGQDYVRGEKYIIILQKQIEQAIKDLISSYHLAPTADFEWSICEK